MPRPRFRREPCDCLDCVDPASAVNAAQQGGTRHAAALQDPPPKCLILYGDCALLRGAASATNASQSSIFDNIRSSIEETNHPHLDGLARDGCSGLLAVESALPGNRHPGHLDRLAQLFALDADARLDSSSPQDLASRYKQLSAAFVSSDSSAVDLARWAGFRQSMPLQQLVEGQPFAHPALSDLPAPRAVAAAAAELLGLVGSISKAGRPAAAGISTLSDDMESDAVTDILLLHVGATETAAAPAQLTAATTSKERFADACALVEWIDAVVQHLNTVSGARESLLLVVLLGSDGQSIGPLLQPGADHHGFDGGGGGPDAAGSPPSGSSKQHGGSSSSGGGSSSSGGGSSALRPRQSFQLCRDQRVAVEQQAPLLCMQRLPAVVRVDGCTRCDVRQAAQRGGDGASLAQRLLPSLAYKLGRAPKYGA